MELLEDLELVRVLLARKAPLPLLGRTLVSDCPNGP